MQLGEIIEKLKDIDKNTIYFYERMGYIKPRQIKVGKVNKRDYSTEDFQMIKAIWKYHKKGYSPKSAYKLAKKIHYRKRKSLDEEFSDLMKKAEKKGITLEAALLRSKAVLKDNRVKKDFMKIINRLLEE